MLTNNPVPEDIEKLIIPRIKTKRLNFIYDFKVNFFISEINPILGRKKGYRPIEIEKIEIKK